MSSGNGTVGCYPEGILESLQMEYWILSRGYTRTFPVGILGFTQREYWILSNRKIDCACCARDLFLFLVSAKGLCSEPTALERRRRKGEGGGLKATAGTGPCNLSVKSLLPQPLSHPRPKQSAKQRLKIEPICGSV